MKRGCCSTRGCLYSVRRLLCYLKQQRRRDEKNETNMLFLGFSWAWLALAGRQANPAITCQVSRLRTPRARATEPCRGVQAGPPACPAAESTRKGPWPESENVLYSTKKGIFTYTYSQSGKLRGASYDTSFFFFPGLCFGAGVVER